MAQPDRFNQNSTEHIMLAALAGDIAYANGDSDTAIQIWRHLPPGGLIYRAQAAVKQEDYRAASTLLANLDQGYVPNSRTQRVYMARILAKLARFSVESGKFADAESYWRWAVLQLPEQAGYYSGLGYTLARQERWEEAIAAYRDAIQLAPNKAPYYVGLANALARQKRWEEVIAAYRDAIQLDPNKAHYYAGLANALARQERWEEAVAAHRDAIQLDPNKVHYYVGLAQALVRMGETEQAIVAARRALELDPNNAAAQRLLQKLGQD